MLSNDEVKILRRWDDAALFFQRRYASHRGFEFKDYAFRQIYGELIAHVMRSLPSHATVLKTDLWNEGIEDGRELASFAKCDEERPICIDISRFVCESAWRSDHSLTVVRATLLASPFRPMFDFVIDASTVDHMPDRLRMVWITSESHMLKHQGILLISFDCRLNLFNELYHRFRTRKKYPEWTLAPSEVRSRLEAVGLEIVREHAIFIAGFLWGTHRPTFPLARVLRRDSVFALLKRMELSQRSRWLSFIAPQYVILARKKN